MVKTKGGRLMNPADAFRKEQRKKEITRNKAERKYIREAFGKKDKPTELREELKELIELEQNGTLNKMQKLRKKIVQEAFDAAVKKQKVLPRILGHAAFVLLAMHPSYCPYPPAVAGLMCTSLAQVGLHLVKAPHTYPPPPNIQLNHI